MRTGAGNPQEDQRHDRLEMGRRRLGEELIVRRAMPRRFIDRHARDLISAAAATLPERIRSPKAAEAAARSMELALGDGTGQEAAWEPVQTDP